MPDLAPPPTVSSSLASESKLSSYISLPYGGPATSERPALTNLKSILAQAPAKCTDILPRRRRRRRGEFERQTQQPPPPNMCIII